MKQSRRSLRVFYLCAATAFFMVLITQPARAEDNSAAALWAVQNLPPGQRGEVIQQGAHGTVVIPTATPTPTPTPTNTPTNTATETPTPTPTPTSTPTSTETPTPTPTNTPCFVPAAPRLKTGQTDCDDSSGDTVPSAACPGIPAGQDGELQKGIARSYTDNGDGTITDNATGLMWEKLSYDASIHDYTNMYTWYEAFTKIASLNSGSFAGHSDWRVPNVNEVQSLVVYNHGQGIDDIFWTNCNSGCTILNCSCTGDSYWSSTSWEFNPAVAWIEKFDFFPMLQPDFVKSGDFGVRAVRGSGGAAQPLRTGQTQCDQGAGTLGVCPGSPAGQDGALTEGVARSYTDNGDGTVIDNSTGLMWEKLSYDGSIHDFTTSYDWYTAFTTKIATLNAATFAGHSDWRLPNINELLSLADYGRTGPAIDPMFNTGCASGCSALTCSCTHPGEFWSSTSFESLNEGTPTAWAGDMEGGAYPYSKSTSALGGGGGPFVRAVRDVTWESTTCAAQNANCGSISDGCGGTLECGSCAAPQSCAGGGVARQCGCTPTTCAAQGAACGQVPDDCGGTLNCGSCTSPDTCGGGGVPNQCGCTPTDTQTICSNANQVCGTRTNNCGQQVSCGTCPSNAPKCCFEFCVSTPSCP